MQSSSSVSVPRESPGGPHEEAIGTVTYGNNPVSIQARNEIEDFFQQLARRCKGFKQPNVASKESEDESSKDTQQVLGVVHYFMEFCLDKAGTPTASDEPQGLANWNVPQYNQEFKAFLPIEEQLLEAQE
jgi:hypothetical protein